MVSSDIRNVGGEVFPAGVEFHGEVVTMTNRSVYKLLPGRFAGRAFTPGVMPHPSAWR